MANAPGEICRFLRVLEYFGTREDLTLARERRQVKGAHSFDGKVKIYEGILGDADQPVIGQLKLWCMQQIVAADEGELFCDNNSMRDGYVSAVQDMLKLILPPTEYKSYLEQDNDRHP